jgi:hypothetical protein
MHNTLNSDRVIHSVYLVQLSKLSLYCMSVYIIWLLLLRYIFLASLVGVYSVPIFRSILPKYGRTSMTAVIGNCTAVLVLSSALPVLARTLGMDIYRYVVIGRFQASRHLISWAPMVDSIGCQISHSSGHTMWCLQSRPHCVYSLNLRVLFDVNYIEGNIGIV